MKSLQQFLQGKRRKLNPPENSCFVCEQVGMDAGLFLCVCWKIASKELHYVYLLNLPIMSLAF